MTEFNGNFTQNIRNSFNADSEVSVLDMLFREYEQVVFRSIVTSFGLDVFIHDKYGGDVDTIHNVRMMSDDPLMHFKDEKLAAEYENRGTYHHEGVTQTGTNYQKIRHEARASYMDNPRINTVQDAYEDKPLGFLGHSKGRPIDKNAELDHVISAKSIFDDRGRVLAGISTAELADSEDNLKWTNEHLNKSMGADEIPDYIKKHPELSAETKGRMMDAYNQAKAAYEKKLYKSYYFDFSNQNCRQFYQAAASSAVQRGFQMALKQALGFLITELWLSVKDSISESDGTFTGVCSSVSSGLKAGERKVRTDYEVLFSTFGDGLLSGIMASVTSTVSNMFVTTAANTGRIIRQGWASVTEAISILLLNEKDQYLCDRMTAAAKVLATGASVIVGTAVQEEVSLKLNEFKIEAELKNSLSAFAGTLCTGFMSVSLLYLIDNGPLTSFLTEIYFANERNLEQQRKMLMEYCAELEKIDVERLQKEADYIYSLTERLDSVSDQKELNRLLLGAAAELGLPSVFGEHSIDERMQDHNWFLRF